MTHEEIMALSGRELDAAVHKCVMDECPHRLHAYAKDNHYPLDWDYTLFRCRDCGQTFAGLAYHEGDVLCPKYSTDWSAMGLLVERMIDVDGPYGAQKWSFGLEYSSVVDWVADFTPRRNHPKSRQYPAFQAQASTAPLAVARASLLALAGEG